MAAATAVTVAVANGWIWLYIGDARAGIVAVFDLGFAACVVGGGPTWMFAGWCDPIEVRFEHGRPIDNGAVLFRRDEKLLDSRENVYEEWCPNSNLLSSQNLAASWAARQATAGHDQSPRPLPCHPSW